MISATLNDLAEVRRWVAWRTEPQRGTGRITKVPKSPHSLRDASSTAPDTWGNRAQAEAADRRLPRTDHGPGGIGLMLGAWQDGLRIGGVDLDTCRDPATDAIEPWAMDVLNLLNSYAEVSPSGTGIKALFRFEAGAVEALREGRVLDAEGHGRSFKRSTGADHPPAIEVFLGRRYFATTEQRLANLPDELRVVPTADLRRLFIEIGPAFARAGDSARDDAGAQHESTRAAGDDMLMARLHRAIAFNPRLHDRWSGSTAGLREGSRSTLAFALGAELKRTGFDYEEMCNLLRRNPHTRAWVAEKGEANGARELRRVWDNAGTGADPRAPREKRPLHREVPPPRPFPMEALGPLQKAAEAVAANTQAPAALAAQSVLAAATLAAQAHANVRLPHGGVRPLTGLFLTIAGSGERKTSTDDIALAEVCRVEEEWRAAYAEEMDAFKRDLAAYKAAIEDAKKAAKKGGRTAIREAIAAVGPEPGEPASPMLLVADPTPEGLVMHLANSRPWAGLFTSEGGLFVGGHAMSDDNKMRTAGLLNVLWDGSPIRRQRVLTGLAFLPGRRVSAHLMMQVSVAGKLLGDAMLDDMGLLARCLTVEPESTIGTRMFRDPPEAARYHLGDYHQKTGYLLRKQPRTRQDDERILDPRVIELSVEARNLWITFHDAVERDIGEGGTLRPIRGFGAKLAEHAARLAAVLAIYAEPDATEVSAERMACGIALAQHYAAEALRLQGAAAVSPDLALAARLLAWWRARPGPRLHLAMIYQRGLNSIDSAEKARRTVAVLEDHGHVRRLPAGIEIDGAPRREAWEVVP